MRTHAPRVSTIVPAANRKCPTCGDYYDISDPADSYPHNNNLCG
ncbi:hypothetical protein [Nocardiopsis sp. MG754419]|nr:hypothetical protein [Nocardiopsis sp. MG754419]